MRKYLHPHDWESSLEFDATDVLSRSGAVRKMTGITGNGNNSRQGKQT